MYLWSIVPGVLVHGFIWYLTELNRVIYGTVLVFEEWCVSRRVR